METRCPHCRGHWTDADHQRLHGHCPVMRIPAGWTYLGLYGTRRGQAKPHYRTAPGVIRTRLTPDHFTAYGRLVARELGIDEDEAADAALYIAYGRRPTPARRRADPAWKEWT